MFRRGFFVFGFILLSFFSFSFGAAPSYYPETPKDLSKISYDVITIKFGNGLDISPCSVVINGVAQPAFYSNGYCSYNMTSLPNVKTSYLVYGVYESNVSMKNISFTYFPTPSVIAEVASFGFFSFVISLFIIFGGVIFS